MINSKQEAWFIMFKKIALAIVIATSVSMTSGCSTNHYSGSEYRAGQVMQGMSVFVGKVVSIRKVKINGMNTGMGLAGGAALAATAGSLVGGGTGRLVSQILFGLAGAVVGATVEGKMSEYEGVEIVVLLGNNQMIGITQVDDAPINKGDLVNVLVSSNNEIRVAPRN